MSDPLSERFTNRARAVFQLATEEARRMSHFGIDSQHLLLGLVIEGSGVAAKVLASARVDGTAVWHGLENELRPALPHGIGINPVQSPSCKQIIEFSMQEARNLNHSYVGTEHLLLGVLRDEHGVAARFLQQCGLSLELARSEVRRLLQQPQPETVIVGQRQSTHTSWLVPALIAALLAAMGVILLLAIS